MHNPAVYRGGDVINIMTSDWLFLCLSQQLVLMTANDFFSCDTAAVRTAVWTCPPLIAGQTDRTNGLSVRKHASSPHTAGINMYLFCTHNRAIYNIQHWGYSCNPFFLLKMSRWFCSDRWTISIMHFNINLWCSVLQYCQLNQIGRIIILVRKTESPQINGVFIRCVQLAVKQVNGEWRCREVGAHPGMLQLHRQTAAKHSNACGSFIKKKV